jgi:hypothetical protein
VSQGQNSDELCYAACAGQRGGESFAAKRTGAAVELNRNHYFMAGVVLLLVGIQLRMVDSYVLNEQSTKLLTPQPTNNVLAPVRPWIQSVTPAPHKVVKPPEALGWALMSIGSVLILHAMAMKAPGAEH